jgi:ankyrin repeat protein
MSRPRQARGANPVERFCRALWQGDHDELADLAERIDPNGADRWNQRPLMMAVQFGELSIVEQLVRLGAEVDQGREHLTPITLAARRKAADIVRFLRKAGARESIVTAVYLGDRKRVARALARDPAAAKLLDEQGTPLLHHAAFALDPEVVELLLARGASVTDAGESQQTALHLVADMRLAPQEPVRAMVTLLLDRGADPNARNWDQVTPLHQAVRARNLAAAEVLLARGADPNARDGIRGSTPLRRAVSATGASGTAGTSALMVPLTRLLLEHGADPDAVDKRGVPVHASARDPAVKAVLAAHRREKPGPRKPGRKPKRS